MTCEIDDTKRCSMEMPVWCENQCYTATSPCMILGCEGQDSTTLVTPLTGTDDKPNCDRPIDGVRKNPPTWAIKTLCDMANSTPVEVTSSESTSNVTGETTITIDGTALTFNHDDVTMHPHCAIHSIDTAHGDPAALDATGKSISAGGAVVDVAGSKWTLPKAGEWTVWLRTLAEVVDVNNPLLGADNLKIDLVGPAGNALGVKYERLDFIYIAQAQGKREINTKLITRTLPAGDYHLKVSGTTKAQVNSVMADFTFHSNTADANEPRPPNNDCPIGVDENVPSQAIVVYSKWLGKYTQEYRDDLLEGTKAEMEDQLLVDYGMNGCIAVADCWASNPTDPLLSDGSWGYANAAESLMELETMRLSGSSNSDIVARGEELKVKWYVREAKVSCTGSGLQPPVVKWLDPTNWYKDGRLGYYTPLLFINCYTSNL